MDTHTTQSTPSNLALCSDCQKPVSKSAFFCVHCGNQFRRQYVDVDRKGWSMTVAWGVILAGIILLIINGIILAILFFLFIGMVAAGMQK